MPDEHKLIRERDRAHLAQQITENPVWIDAWEKMVGNLRAHMESPASSDEAALEARRGLLVLNRLRAEVEAVMSTGKLATLELERIKSNGRH